MEVVRVLLQDWVDKGLLPGAALRVIHDQRVWYACDVGKTSITGDQSVTAETLFDLASLTKVTATLPALLLLFQEGSLAPDDQIGTYFPDCPADKSAITISQLLTHTSGLPADLAQRRRDSQITLPQLLFQQELLHAPGTQVIYSDLGMIWLGLLIEKVTGEKLDDYVAKHIFKPLGMNHTFYCPNTFGFTNISHTEYCLLTKKYIAGEVHDEKAFVMGGVAGHAGLFSTADDLCRYAMSWLYGFPPLLTEEWRKQAVYWHTVRASGSRGYGWELNGSETPISCGSGFHPSSYGHTGFTGTSIWIDPVQDLAVIFLTNAIHLGRNHQLRQLRPLLHDAVTAQLHKSLTE
ncbi:serine hydrolase [Brevibacillus reuszeri]|uniref:Penicillin-binding protein n=1 Tax=Brevibacillus reuszeri TaxID=54915 RepID=A0A0K9YXB2_9BACL|nr:serine hydrolase domain-containing protein [Brevibacillus reuszeri]KNB73311.1 penicillin-binding protein [Brevibacillus reuszeri]MED1856931.1 serine hydrolase [Brevibacillus reuszeri]GED68320.1 serine hydrolase [Brevibacillus reuszeri]